MCSVNHDFCVVCSKTVKNCHKNIKCKSCCGYVHKKCTKLKPKQMKNINLSDWTCSKCSSDDITLNHEDGNSGLDQSFSVFDVTNVDLKKYDDMIFNPLRFDHNTKIGKTYKDVVNNSTETAHECLYQTPEQFSLDTNVTGNFNLLNINIRSISKNFDKLKECTETLKCDFDVIGISETHLKDKPNEIFSLPGYSIEYTNRVKRVVCACISLIN